MRFGFTTGSCAAAGAKAACYMLLTGNEKREIVIKTPKGLDCRAEILGINRSENQVSCAVVKDGGDDPDITTGAHIVSTVRFLKDEKSHIANENTNTDKSDGKPKNPNPSAFVVIKGGKGV